jgi:hypothetical protein
MVLNATECSTWQEAGPLPTEAVNFIRSVSDLEFQYLLVNNPSLLPLLNDEKQTEQTTVFTLQRFYELHSQEFPQSSIAILNISAGLFEDLLWSDVYFIDDLRKKLADGDFHPDDLLQAGESYEEAVHLLQSELGRLLGGGSGPVNPNTHFVM